MCTKRFFAATSCPSAPYTSYNKKLFHVTTQCYLGNLTRGNSAANMAVTAACALNALASTSGYPGDEEAIHQLIGDYFSASDNYGDDWTSGM